MLYRLKNIVKFFLVLVVKYYTKKFKGFKMGFKVSIFAISSILDVELGYEYGSGLPKKE